MSSTARSKNVTWDSSRSNHDVIILYKHCWHDLGIFFSCRYEELCRVDEDEEDLEEELQSCNVERCQVRVTPPAKPRLRIREDVRDQHCRTLRQALHVWMDQFPEDFDDPPNYNSLTHLEAFCRRVLPNSELDIKVHRKASQIRRPMEPSPPHKLGYPTGSSKPPPLVLKSANLVNGLNNNSVHHHFHAYAKDRQPFNEDLTGGGGGPTRPPGSPSTGWASRAGRPTGRRSGSGRAWPWPRWRGAAGA